MLVFQFMSKSSPKWSELVSGGMTEQVRSSVGVERKARSIRVVDPIGLTCVYVGTTCSRKKYQIIWEKGDDEA